MRQHFNFAAIVTVIAAIVLTVMVSSAWALPTHDTFWVTLEGDNELYAGGGSGWSATGGEGEWIEYDQTDWWNQWFYNDPPDPDRWKEISYDIDLETYSMGTGTMELQVEVALNWSTVDFPPTGPDGSPPQPDQEQFIERHEIYSGSLLNEDIIGDYVIPDYNPEWVSIDVRVYAWEQIEIHEDPGTFERVSMQVNISGDIWHECVPEPATLALMLLGGLALLRYRR